MSGGGCAGTILKSHILPNVLCSGAAQIIGDVDDDSDNKTENLSKEAPVQSENKAKRKTVQNAKLCKVHK